MAVLRSDDTSTTAAIGATSKAVSTAEYNSQGDLLYPAIPSGFMLPINIRFSVALGANSVLWSVWAGEMTARSVRIRKIYLSTGFDGTAAASSMSIDILRFFGAAPTAGNTLSPVQVNGYQQSETGIIDARVCTGAVALTATGVVADTHVLASLEQPSRVNSNGLINWDADRMGLTDGLFDLSPYSGLMLRLGSASVIGHTIGGTIVWEEW